jgi:hypothetical protein
MQYEVPNTNISSIDIMNSIYMPNHSNHYITEIYHSTCRGRDVTQTTD